MFYSLSQTFIFYYETVWCNLAVDECAWPNPQDKCYPGERLEQGGMIQAVAPDIRVYPLQYKDSVDFDVVDAGWISLNQS